MPQVCDYMVHPGTFKLTHDDVDEVVVDFPKMGIGGQRDNCILGMMVSTQNTTNNFTVEVRINGPLIFTYGPTGTNLTRFFTDVFHGLSYNKKNRVHVKIVAGSGSFSILNMILWFHRTI